jgi:hypothetical protein
MVRMVVTAEHQYAGRRMQPGQEHDCEQQHVALMRSRGWAKPVAQEPAQYNTRAMTARSRSR